MLDQRLIDSYLAKHPYPLLFVTMSGAHLYGFESPDSDYDLRGAHVAPARLMMGFSAPPETYEIMDKDSPIEMDLVTHDVRKFLLLLLKNNGYVLEQVLSPICVYSTPEYEELKALAPRTITKHHHHHFRNFGTNQWESVVKNGKPTVKGMLYTYRVLLVGIHLMRTHTVESNLRKLNEIFKLSYIDDLIARKVAGREKAELADELSTHEKEFNRLLGWLEHEKQRTTLPDGPSCRAELEDLLIRLRMKQSPFDRSSLHSSR